MFWSSITCGSCKKIFHFSFSCTYIHLDLFIEREKRKEPKKKQQDWEKLIRGQVSKTATEVANFIIHKWIYCKYLVESICFLFLMTLKEFIFPFKIELQIFCHFKGMDEKFYASPWLKIIFIIFSNAYLLDKSNK